MEIVLPNANYRVKKLISNKTQLLHHIRLRKYEPNTELQDNRPEDNFHPDGEIVIPQDVPYVITWSANFGEFPNSNEEITIPKCLDAADNSNSLWDGTSPPGENFTDMDLRSIGPHENESYDPTEKTRSGSTNDRIDEQESSGGSDTIVP